MLKNLKFAHILILSRIDKQNKEQKELGENGTGDSNRGKAKVAARAGEPKAKGKRAFHGFKLCEKLRKINFSDQIGS